jgi:hypothetical protein
MAIAPLHRIPVGVGDRDETLAADDIITAVSFSLTMPIQTMLPVSVSATKMSKSRRPLTVRHKSCSPNGTDPDTGELYFFGYEAGGLTSPDVAYCVANRDGELVREDWLQVPYWALMHDFAVTQEHVVFPRFPITADLARMRAGGPHWAWEGDRDSFIGIMPRDGRIEHLRWFRGPPCAAFHFVNAFTAGSRVHIASKRPGHEGYLVLLVDRHALPPR